MVPNGGTAVFTSVARLLPPSVDVLPWRQTPLPFPRASRRSRLPAGFRLDLRGFRALLSAEGLAERLPDLEERVGALAHTGRQLYGFSFAPSDVRIAVRDLPWLLAGLEAGLTLRPLVIESPRSEDVASLGLDPGEPILRYRLRCLARSGMRIIPFHGSLALAEQFRWPERRSLADALETDGLRSLPEVYEELGTAPTIGSRVGQRPRLVLVGRHLGPRRGPLLGTRDDAGVRVIDPATFPTAASVLEAGCRLLTPEEALLLAASPDLRDDTSTFLGCDGPILLGALTPYARIATFTSHEAGIQLGTADPWRVHAADRLVAVTG